MTGEQRINNVAFIIIIIIIIILRWGISVGTVTRQRNGRPRNRRTICRRRKLLLPLSYPPHCGPCSHPLGGCGRGDCYTRWGQRDRGVDLTGRLPLIARLKNEWRCSFVSPLYVFRCMYRIVTYLLTYCMVQSPS